MVQTCWTDLLAAAPASPSNSSEPAFSSLAWLPNLPVLLVMDVQGCLGTLQAPGEQLPLKLHSSHHKALDFSQVQHAEQMQPCALRSGA